MENVPEQNYKRHTDERMTMNEIGKREIRRDEDGDPIVTGTSFTTGTIENDELEETLIQEVLKD